MMHRTILFSFLIISLFVTRPVYVLAQNKDTIPNLKPIAPVGGLRLVGQFEPAPDEKDIILKGSCVMLYMDMKTRLPMPGVCVALVCITDQTRQYAKTDSQGNYQFTLLYDKKYYFMARKKGYGNSKTKDTISTIGITKPARMYRSIYFLEHFVYVFPLWIHYAKRNETDLDSNAENILGLEIDRLKEYPYLTMEINSHTDCRGTNRQCDSISLRRALIVKRYMVSRGVDSSRLIVHGYGKRAPLNKCGCTPYKRHNKRECTKAENMANNRTEYRYLNNDYTQNDGEVFECDEK